MVREADPTPALAAQIVDECERLLGLLGDETLTLSRPLEDGEDSRSRRSPRGFGCVDLAVKRKLRVIRKLWAEETAAAADTDES